MLLGFAACSSSDDDNDFDEKDHPKRKVSKIETYVGWGVDDDVVSYTEYFTYDKDGRWTKYRRDGKIGDRHGQNIGTIYSFILDYRNDLISLKERFVLEENFPIVHEKDMNINGQGYISKTTEEFDAYYYENKNLVSVDHEGEEALSYVYEGDQVVGCDFFGNKIKITYTTIENKMNFGLVPLQYEDSAFDFTFNNPLAQFGLFGKQPKYLVKTIVFNYNASTTTINYRYIVDNEGFVTEVRKEERWSSNNDVDIEVCKIYYE